MEETADVIDLSASLGRANVPLGVISACPRTESLRLSLKHARNLLPTDIVHLCLILEVAAGLGFPSIELEAPDPSYLGVYLWRIGLWDLFPEYAPSAPIRPLKRGNTEKCIELTRFTDLSGAVALGERLPTVLTSAAGAADVQGGTRTLKRLADAVYELAENAVAHSHQLSCQWPPRTPHWWPSRYPPVAKCVATCGQRKSPPGGLIVCVFLLSRG
jgi:hypothetical protein